MTSSAASTKSFLSRHSTHGSVDETSESAFSRRDAGPQRKWRLVGAYATDRAHDSPRPWPYTRADIVGGSIFDFILPDVCDQAYVQVDNLRGRLWRDLYAGRVVRRTLDDQPGSLTFDVKSRDAEDSRTMSRIAHGRRFAPTLNSSNVGRTPRWPRDF